MLNIGLSKLGASFVWRRLFGVYAGCDQVLNFSKQGLLGKSVFWQYLLHIAIQRDALLRGHVLRGHYNYGDRSPLVLLAELGEKLITVHSWHHQIQEDQVGPLFRNPLQCH